MKIAKSFRAIVAGFLFFTSGLVAAVCCPPVIDSVWYAGMMTAQASVSAAIISMVETVAATRAINLQFVLGAIKVLTKQINVSTDQQMNAVIAAKKGGAQYLTELATRKAMFNVIMDYNGVTGQGFNPCDELKRSKRIAVAVGEANSDMKEKVIREIDAAPGRLADQSMVLNKRMNDAKTRYCTPKEAEMGLCKAVGTLSGKDVDAANFFASSHITSPEGQAKSALMNHLYGIPHQPIPKELAGSPQAQAFFENKRVEDAFRSVSQTSLKSIQSWTESRGTGNVTTDSVVDTIAKKVNTYSGGENYADWERSKTNQSERGLLVEYAKMMATELYLLHLEYQSQERLEANVAALQALKARQNPNVGEAYAQSAATRKKVQ